MAIVEDCKCFCNRCNFLFHTFLSFTALLVILSAAAISLMVLCVAHLTRWWCAVRSRVPLASSVHLLYAWQQDVQQTYLRLFPPVAYHLPQLGNHSYPGQAVG